MGEPVKGWLDVIRHIDKVRDDLAARIAQTDEVSRANHERFDDWAAEQRYDWELFKATLISQLQHIGRNAEEALKWHELHDFQHIRRHEVESMRQAQEAHVQQHAESRQAATAVTVAQLDNRTKVILALIGLAQFVAGLLIGGAR